MSVNPVDTKIRRSAAPDTERWKVLGRDAAGIVTATGPGVTTFRPGDEVWHDGNMARTGSNAELYLVDERIVWTC